MEINDIENQRTLFEIFDANEDGLISKEEFIDCLKDSPYY